MINPYRLLNPMRRLVAADPMAHDIYLVEFPKSGMTWLCTLLANLALTSAGNNARATYFSVQHYIPDIHMSGGLPLGRSLLEGIPQRLIKSHAGQNRYYQNVIYLVRHPVAVMQSYHRYLNQHPHTSISQEQLLSDRKFGLPAWQRHVRGWLQHNGQDHRLHLIRYEDLVTDTVHELQSVSENIGWPFSRTQLEHAASLSTAAEMKLQEQRYRQHNPNYTMEFVKGSGDVFSADLADTIRKKCSRELELLGYQDG